MEAHIDRFTRGKPFCLAIEPFLSIIRPHYTGCYRNWHSIRQVSSRESIKDFVPVFPRGSILIGGFSHMPYCSP